MKRTRITALLALAIVFGAPLPAGAFMDNLIGIGSGGPLPSGRVASGRIVGAGGAP